MATVIPPGADPDPAALHDADAAHTLPGAPPYRPPYASVAHLLYERAKAIPEAPYLVAYTSDGRRVEHRYADFVERVERVTGYLIRLGIGRGDRISTVLLNHPDAVFLYFAAWSLGAAVVPINTEETAARKRFILANAGSRYLFTLPEYLGEVLGHANELPALRGIVAVDAPARPASSVPDGVGRLEEGLRRARPVRALAGRPEDEALIVYTSGTTGNPKGVVLTQQNLLADAESIAAWFRIQPGERWMCVLPIHHVNGILVTLLSPLYAGGSVVLNPRFSATHFWQRAAAEGVAVASLVPTLLEFLLEADEDITRYDLSHLRGLICGAGPLAVSTVLRFEERFGVPVWHGYGLSETTAYACMTPVDLPDTERRHWYRAHGFPTIGAPMPYQDLSIRGPDGDELPAGQRGEICIRGATIMRGYYQRPDANEEAFRFPGWFRSGDEGFWLPGPGGRRFFFITGRIKELIIRGGVNLSPFEIDDVLRTHPAVRIGLAVPFENRYYGEEVAAYVVPREGFEPSEALAEDIKAHCRRHLPFPMQPKVVVFGSEVPYTSTGKARRIEVKRLVAEQLAPYRDHQFRENPAGGPVTPERGEGASGHVG